MSTVTGPLLTPEIIALAKTAHTDMPFKNLWRSAKSDLKNYGYDELLAEFIAFGSVSERRADLLRRYIDLMTGIVNVLSDPPRSHDESWAAEEEAQQLRDHIEPAILWSEVYAKRYPTSTGSL
jgi:hypothetical protein